MFWEFSGDREGDLLGAIHTTLFGAAAVPGDPADPGNVGGPEPGAAGLPLWIEGGQPVRGPVVLGYALPRADRLDVRIRDVTGATIRRLDEGHRMAGSHRLTWDGCDASGRRAPAGIYFLDLRTSLAGAAYRFVFLSLR